MPSFTFYKSVWTLSFPNSETGDTPSLHGRPKFGLFGVMQHVWHIKGDHVVR